MNPRGVSWFLKCAAIVTVTSAALHGSSMFPANPTGDVFLTASTGGGEEFQEEIEMRAEGGFKGTNGLRGIYLKEIQPADEFIEGNWGEPTNGILMSIRVCGNNLDTATNLVIGQPVRAAILLRNIGAERIGLGWASWVNYSFLLSMTRNGTNLEPRIPALKPRPWDGSAATLWVQPGTQRREMLRLDKIYDLTLPGNYEVSAEHRRHGVSAKSGTANFSLALQSEPHTPLRVGESLSASIVLGDGRVLSPRLVVTPDGTISVPPHGEMQAAGRTLDEIRKELLVVFGNGFAATEVTIVRLP